MIKRITHILFALRFYVALTILAWLLLPVPEKKSDFKIFRFTYDVIQWTTTETERLMEERAAQTATLRNGARTFSSVADHPAVRASRP